MNFLNHTLLLALRMEGEVVLIFLIPVFVGVIVGLCKTFEKAGRPALGAIIPFYNIILLLEIAGKEGWMFILYFIPPFCFFFPIIVSIALAKQFGKGVVFGLGLAFLGFIFFPILGFGSAEYQGVK